MHRSARRWLPLGLLAALGCGGSEPEKPLPWNFVFITIDTLRADHLGSYGYPRATSPEIDRFARTAVQFDNAVAQWPKTTPSFASMLTSTYGSTSGVRQMQSRVPDRFPLLAESLQQAGYATHAMVYNPSLGKQFAFHRGFDEYIEAWTLPDAAIYQARNVTREGVRIMQERDRSKPMFLWVHYIDPHTPYEPPEEFHEMFVGDEYDVESKELPVLDVESALAFGGIGREAQLGENTRLGYYVAQYDAEIRTTDTQVGILFEEIDRLLGPNTMIVLTSDHGESLGETNSYFAHGRFPYNSCAHVPLYVRIPDQPQPGRRVETVVGLIDLFPTVMDLLGLPFPRTLEGQSIADLIYAEPTSQQKVAYTESGRANREFPRSIRDKEWKLIWVPDPKDQELMLNQEFELYNMLSDPKETKDVAAKHPKVVERLRGTLMSWMQSKAFAELVPEIKVENLDTNTQEQLRALGYIR